MEFKIKKNYIKEKIVGQVVFEDLNTIMPKKVFVEINDDELYNVVRDESVVDIRTSHRTDYLDIDAIIPILNDMKESGSKFIQIYPNKYDHSYHLTGVTLEKMTDVEVENIRVAKLKRHISAVKQSIVSCENTIERGKKQIAEHEKGM